MVWFKIIEARLQQYVNRELPGVQAGFRKCKESRDQIANIHWIIEKARKFQKKICISALLIMPKSSKMKQTKLVEVLEFQLSYFRS